MKALYNFVVLALTWLILILESDVPEDDPVRCNGGDYWIDELEAKLTQ